MTEPLRRTRRGQQETCDDKLQDIKAVVRCHSEGYKKDESNLKRLQRKQRKRKSRERWSLTEDANEAWISAIWEASGTQVTPSCTATRPRPNGGNEDGTGVT